MPTSIHTRLYTVYATNQTIGSGTMQRAYCDLPPVARNDRTNVTSNMNHQRINTIRNHTSDSRVNSPVFSSWSNDVSVRYVPLHRSKYMIWLYVISWCKSPKSSVVSDQYCGFLTVAGQVSFKRYGHVST